MFIRQEGLPYPQPWEWVRDNIKFDTSEQTYVDIGANDGYTYSNTIYFENVLNWKGICIEPHPTAFKKLENTRKSANYNCCISDKDENIDFLLIEGYAEMLSGIYDKYDPRHLERIEREIEQNGGYKKIVEIQSRRINDILEENSLYKIGYLSIDTEGSELEILKSIDYDKFDIRIISCENNGYSDDAKLFVISKGYYHIGKVCGDDIFEKIR
jgi:FkbM family methyltransferase